jgi:pSer/pThr/pTyr-binding forkhead associated (FHA) protein
MNFYLVPVEQGRRIVLDKAIVFVGRHPECDVVLSRSRKISRRHCCFTHVNDAIYVRDLGSMNGVSINGRRVAKEAPIAVGDTVAIADLAYVLKAKGNGAEEKAGESRPRKVKRVKPAASPPSAKPSDRDLLSQEVPVPIEEDAELEEFEAVMIDEDDVEDVAEDDVLLLEDSSEH